MKARKNVEECRRASTLALALRGLAASLGLQTRDAASLVGKACPMSWAAAGEVIQSDEGAPGAKLIVRGWACESRTLPTGRRQIFDFLLPGDICFPPAGGRRGRVEVRALTAVGVLSLAPALRRPEGARLRELLRRAHALNLERRYDAAVRLGQLTAEERTMDLLEELRERLGLLELVNKERFRLPLSQAQLADGLGLSTGHLNRTIAALRRRALVEVAPGEVRLPAAGERGRPGRLSIARRAG